MSNGIRQSPYTPGYWLLRLAVVGVAIALWVLGFAWDLDNPPDGRPPFTEGAAIEHFQFSVLLACVALAFAAGGGRELRPERWFLGALFAIFAIREQDEFWEHHFGDGVWPIFVTLILIALAFRLWQLRAHLRAGIAEFLDGSPGGLFAAAFSTLIFSRIFGAGAVWTAILGEGFPREVKNVVEESIECMAMLLFLMAMLEYCLRARLGRTSD